MGDTLLSDGENSLATVDNTLPIDPFVAWRMTNEAK
jgi:hypothetical protein